MVNLLSIKVTSNNSSQQVWSVSNAINVNLMHLITVLHISILKWAFLSCSRPFLEVLYMRHGGKCQAMTFSSVKGTSVHLFCSSQLSDHLPNPVWASLPYARRPSDKRNLCETNIKGALRSSRSGSTNEEKDKTNVTVCYTHSYHTTVVMEVA